MSNNVPNIIRRDLPNAVVYDLSTPGHVKITLPPTSTWTSGLHWHETHDEYLKVVKGSIRVRLGDVWTTVSATEKEQPEVKVARYVWHEWKRAEPDEEVVVIERTDPVDDEKALFFWNLNGVILSAPKLLRDGSSLISRLPAYLRGPALDFWITLNLFVIFASLDNFPVFFEMSEYFPARIIPHTEWIVSHLVLYSASWLGWAIGLQPVSREFTPSQFYESWSRNRHGGLQKKQV